MIDRDELAMLLADNNHLIALLEWHDIDWRPLTESEIDKAQQGRNPAVIAVYSAASGVTGGLAMQTVFQTVLLFVAILALAACHEVPVDSGPERARPAKLFTVADPGGAGLRTFPGTVQASNHAELAYRVAGELIELPAHRGKRVRQGELLARLDPSDYEAVLEDRTAQYELALAQHERGRQLVDQGVISQADFEQLQARMRVTRSDLTRAENNLAYTRLYAPFDGVIARQLVENHENVAAGQVVLVLQTGDRVNVIVDVPESVIARVQRRPDSASAVPVKVRFSPAEDRLYDAEYKEHEASADPATLSYKVTFSLPAPEDINVLPGMTASVLVDLAAVTGYGAAGYLLPVEAVFSAEDEPVESPSRFIWKLDPQTMRANRQPVTVGDLTGDGIVVLDGIQAGEMVVAAGVHTVTEGMLLRPMTREAGL